MPMFQSMGKPPKASAGKPSGKPTNPVNQAKKKMSGKAQAQKNSTVKPIQPIKPVAPLPKPKAGRPATKAPGATKPTKPTPAGKPTKPTPTTKRF
jgi:hypothetical protein